MEQLGFDALLSEAADDNAAHQFAQEAAHLPRDWDAAVCYLRDKIEEHHNAMLACDFDRALAIREDAHLLARKLNSGEPGILAHDNAPGYRLAAACAAELGAVPLWGQDGDFELNLDGLRLRVEIDGVFGIGARARSYLGFSVRAVDRGEPFISNTGYRSFLGASVPPEPGLTPDVFVQKVISHYVASDLNGKLVPIAERYR